MRTARTSRPLLLALALVASMSAPAAWGCGGSAAEAYERDPGFEPEREDPVELESEQVGLNDQLSDVLARPEPDCERACELGDAICELSERICGIADRHPEDEATAGRCRDGAARCEAARERIAETCTCAAP